MKPSLHDTPSLDHLDKQARQLLAEHKRADTFAFCQLRRLPQFREATDAEIAATKVTLAQAQDAVAMAYGYLNWALVAELAARGMIASTGGKFTFFRDYQWATGDRFSTGKCVGVGMISPADGAYFKFIALPDGDRVEQFDADGRFIRVVHDPADGIRGERRLHYQDEAGRRMAVLLDESGAVRSRETYTYLSNPGKPQRLRKTEVFNADGRLLEVQIAHRTGPATEDVRITDVLGKLKSAFTRMNLHLGRDNIRCDE